MFVDWVLIDVWWLFDENLFKDEKFDECCVWLMFDVCLLFDVLFVNVRMFNGKLFD